MNSRREREREGKKHSTLEYERVWTLIYVAYIQMHVHFSLFSGIYSTYSISSKEKVHILKLRCNRSIQILFLNNNNANGKQIPFQSQAKCKLNKWNRFSFILSNCILRWKKFNSVSIPLKRIVFENKIQKWIKIRISWKRYSMQWQPRFTLISENWFSSSTRALFYFFKTSFLRTFGQLSPPLFFQSKCTKLFV